MFRPRTAFLLAGLVLLAMASAIPAYAQPELQAETTPELSLITDYPSQVIGVGEIVTITLKLRAGSTAQVVSLDVQDLPEQWTASFRGKGRTVYSAYVEPDTDTLVDLRLELPLDATAGTYRLSVIAQSDQAQAALPLELVVQEKAPASLSLEAELPTLRGKPSTTFRYNVTLTNQGDEDLTVDLSAQTSASLSVAFKLSGNEVTSVPVETGGSKRLSVEAAFLVSNATAGSYPITILAQSPEVSATLDLIAEVVGESTISLTTPDGRLSGQAEAGRDASFALIVENRGSAAARGVTMRASAPSSWTVEFQPEYIDQIDPGQYVEVTAVVQPAEKALAGDYVVTFRAEPEEAITDSIDYRVTVRTSTMWGIVGVVLIAVAVAAVGLAVRRFGRR